MCGIIAGISGVNITNILLTVLNLLQNRGYDSVGICTLMNESLNISKYASGDVVTDDCMDKLYSHEGSHLSNIGIGHTRWATHGGKTDKNAHPHTDYKNRIAVVHNGVITNYKKIKTKLEKNNIVFESETDTEVISQSIGFFMDNGMSVEDAVKETVNTLTGSWAVVVIDRLNPDRLIVCKNGSPVVIGFGENATYICSEIQVLSNHITKYIRLKEGEICIVKKDSIQTLYEYEMKHISGSKIDTTPFPWKHWTIKEINHQPECIRVLLKTHIVDGRVVIPAFDKHADSFTNVSNMIISGCGSSMYAGKIGMYIMRDLDIFNTIQCVDAGEFYDKNVPKEGGGMIVMSQSGETKDTHRALLTVKNIIPTIGIINKKHSVISVDADECFYVQSGRENGVAATKSFMSQSISIVSIAIWFWQLKHDSVHMYTSILENIPDRIETVIKTTYNDCKNIAKKLKNKTSIYLLGKGLSHAIALESALKIKEICYIHAEGFGGSSLKHGPLALIEQKTSILMFIFDDIHYELNRVIAHEVKSRGAWLIVITDIQDLDLDVDDIIIIPSIGELTPLLSIVPIQLLAYEISILKHINPDRPKNLAKTVTVD